MSRDTLVAETLARLPIMQTSFTLTPADFGRYQKLVRSRIRRQVAAWKFNALPTLICAFIGAAVALLMRIARDAPDMAVPLYIAVFLLVLALLSMLAAAPLQQALIRKHTLLPEAAFLSHVNLTLTDTALVMDSDRVRSEMAWSGFVDMAQDEHSHYLFIDAMQAVIVPKAAVTGFRAEFERHVSRIKPVR
jgi:hypothetical protein